MRWGREPTVSVDTLLDQHPPRPRHESETPNVLAPLVAHRLGPALSGSSASDLDAGSQPAHAEQVVENLAMDLDWQVLELRQSFGFLALGWVAAGG